MKHSLIYHFSIYLLLLAAYNPLTTFVFNKTGFYGASIHQLMMLSAWLVFVVVNIRIALKVLDYKLAILLFLILSYAAFSIIRGIQYGTLMNSVADVAYFVEVWLFYFAAMISVHSTTAKRTLLVYKNVFIINAIGLAIIFTFFKTELYFTGQLGPLRMYRVLDFLIVSGLLLILYGNQYKDFSKTFFILLLMLFIFVNLIGFSRGVWLAVLIIMFFNFTLRVGSSLYRLRMRIMPVQIVVFATIAIVSIYLMAQFSVLQVVLIRLFQLDYNTVSIGGRFTAYLSLFTGTFSDFGKLFFGSGAGAFMPGLKIPASSSPSFFGTVLYVHGFPVFALAMTVIGILTYRLQKLSFQNKMPFGRFPIYNIVAHILILNIFPTVNHFPILGFLIFISIVMLNAKEKHE